MVTRRCSVRDGTPGRWCGAVIATLALAGCSHFPRIDYGDNLVIGCPAPIGPNEPQKTLTDGSAVIALVEAMTLCEDDLITHPEDRDFQKRLALQARMEKQERKARERAVREAAAGRGPAAVPLAPYDAPPRG